MRRRIPILYWDEGWNCMQKEIMKLKRILEGLPETHFILQDHMTLNLAIRTMCTQQPPHDYSQQLYDKYKEVFEEYITSTVLPSLREKHDEFMLRELVKRWENHKEMVRRMKVFFHYLDQNFIPQKSLPTLYEVGFACFHDLVYTEFKDNAQDVIITLIDREREGELIDGSLLKNVLDIYVETGCVQDFEAHLLQETGAYYSRKASNWILKESCPDYLLKCVECVVKEKNRVSQYLRSSIESKLVEKVQHELLVVRATELLEKEDYGCRALLKADKREDLARMFRLFREIPEGLERMANVFKQHITAEVTVLVQHAGDAAMNHAGHAVQEPVLIEKIIELHDKYMADIPEFYMSRIAHCFQNHTLFHKALKEVFEVFCNKTVGGSSCSELLATFCDNILKKGASDEKGNTAIEETLEKAVKLLAYISDRELFAKFYRKKLARRLLSDRSANDAHERSILKKLQQQYGQHFTSNMEGMVTDLTLARENQTDFEEYLSNNSNANPSIDLSVTVLNARFWPSYKSSDLNLPTEMVKCVEGFKGFYETKAEHKKLDWINSLGQCSVDGNFEQKTIELIVSTYQAATLLLFNSADRLSFSEIMTQLKLTHDDLVRLLQSLSSAKYKILLKVPNGKTISQNDYFEFNSKFTDRMSRIEIPPPLDDDPPVNEKKEVVEDRRHSIECAIVYIMKRHRVLGHQQLVSMCFERLSPFFQPDNEAVMKCVEDLIEKEYLERDKEKPNTLRYLP